MWSVRGVNTENLVPRFYLLICSYWAELLADIEISSDHSKKLEWGQESIAETTDVSILESSTAAARRNDAVTWVHLCKQQPVLGTSRGTAAQTPSSETLTGWEIAGMRCSLSKLFPSHYATLCPSQHTWNTRTGTDIKKQRLLLCLILQSVICVYAVVQPSHS